MIWEILEDVLRNSILITGLVVIMMMMIDSLNITSDGRFFRWIRGSRVGSVLTGSILGVIPGCMGGFATVSLYTHGMLSFGALVAMMIASSGDEAFVMLAAIPKQSAIIFGALFVIAIVVGLLVDTFVKKSPAACCDEKFEVHEEDHHHSHETHKSGRHFGWKRLLMILGTAAFVVALVSGWLEHEHAEEGHEAVEHGINLLDEEWMNYLFAGLSVIMIGVIAFGSDHFVDHHLWHHVIAKHLPTVFAWTAGVLLAVTVLLEFCDISSWISDNTALMILLAVAIGLIPESGPHMIFVTLFAAGVVPMPVLLASCISQDGHASLPLFAESKKSFLFAKLVNCAVALAAGFGSMLLI